MKEMSIFVDESGDFGDYDFHSPYYIVSMVIHDQDIDINDNLFKLEYDLSNLGMPQHCIHSGPLIRGEEEYRYLSVTDRQRILKRLMAFTRKTDLSVKCVFVEKKESEDIVDLTFRLTKRMSESIRDSLDYFRIADVVKLYYDNGQVELTKILVSVFSVLLDNVEYKKVIPSDYRLFQVADLACTIKLTELKFKNKTTSKSELIFFKDERTFKKNYLKVFNAKSI